MPHLRDIHLIVFDLDGTLVQSHFDLCDATNIVLARYGRPLLNYESIQPLLGSGLSALLREALQTEDMDRLAEAEKIFHLYYREHYADKTIPYPGVKKTLEKLRGVRKAVFSNKSHPFTVGMIQQLGLTPYFDQVLGTTPGKTPFKPDPAGLRRIMTAMKVEPAHTLMVGDSTHDIEVGKAAGARTAAVAYGYRALPLLLALEPDLVLHQFSELVAQLEIGD